MGIANIAGVVLGGNKKIHTTDQKSCQQMRQQCTESKKMSVLLSPFLATSSKAAAATEWTTLLLVKNYSCY